MSLSQSSSAAETRAAPKETGKPPAAVRPQSSLTRARLAMVSLAALLCIACGVWWGSQRLLLSRAQEAAMDDRLAEAEYWLETASRWALNPAASVFGRAHVARLAGDIDGCSQLLVMAENIGFSVTASRREQELLELQSGVDARLLSSESSLEQLALEDREHCEAVAKGLLVKSNALAAMAVLDKWLETQPESARLITLKAKILLDIGKESEALPLYQQAVALNPSLLSARIGLADTLLATEKLTECLTHYEVAISQMRRFIKPQDVSATDADRYINCNLAKAHVLMELQREQLGIETLKPLIESFPGNFAARYLLATAYSKRGESKQVIDTIEPIMQRFPRDVSLNYLLADAESKRGNLERSEWLMQIHLDGRAHLDELKKLEFESRSQPPSSELCLRIALGYLDYRWDDAEPWLERAYQLQRDSPGVLLAWASYYQKLGKTKKAARYLEAARRTSAGGTQSRSQR